VPSASARTAGTDGANSAVDDARLVSGAFMGVDVETGKALIPHETFPVQAFDSTAKSLLAATQ
jgi:hypothetical protein